MFNFDRYIMTPRRATGVKKPKTIDDFDLEPFTSESTGSQSTLAQLADQGAFGPQREVI